MARLDPHSYNDTEQPEIDFIDWRARIEFRTRVIDAEAILTLWEPGLGALDLDTRDLQIDEVFGEHGEPLEYTLSPPEPILGSRLRIALPAGTRRIQIRYRTVPTASALQWLSPAQT